MTFFSPTIPRVTGVVGGGRMGSGIAHALLLAGSSVAIVEENPNVVNDVRERIVKALGESFIRGVLIEAPPAIVKRLTISPQMSSLRDASLVVEAVPEDLSLKKAVFSSIERHVSSSTVIATNTSSLSVTSLASSLQHPQRVIGLHFFNPVPSSQLVEIVTTRFTEEALVESARGWVEAMKKTPIVISDSPGFASSRLGLALSLEAIRMLEEGVASAQDIDTAMELGYKHPIGPLRLTDLVGLDVRLHIAKYLSGALGARFEPPELLSEKVAKGELGRKSGRGFYDWDG